MIFSCCFGLHKRCRVAPGPAGCQQQTASTPRVHAAKQLDKALGELLIAASLWQQALSYGNQFAHTPAPPRLPTNLTSLQRQLETAAVQQQKKGRDCFSLVASQSSNLLKAYEQQQHKQQAKQVLAPQALGMGVPAADALVGLAAAIMFPQVTLDSAAVLSSRHEQLQQLIATAGFHSFHSLAVCLQPANKAVLACVLLGRCALHGDAKATCTVRRQAAFWDALPQWQQQGIIPATLPPPEPQQQPGRIKLAKLFPRFADESLLHQSSSSSSPSSSFQKVQPRQQQHELWLGQAQAISGAEEQHGFDCGSVVIEAGEGHGPRKEFFQAAAVNWTTATPHQPALLVYIRSRGTWWINSTLCPSPKLQQAYWAMGWLLGQALSNRCTLGLPLAPLMFHYMLMQQQGPAATAGLTLALLKQHDPDAANSLRSILKLPGQQYEQLLQVEQLPGHMSRQDYTLHAVRQLLLTDVQWQLRALQQGFTTAADPQALLDCCFDGISLAEAVCGLPAGSVADFKVQEAFRMVLEDDDCDSDDDEGCEGSNMSVPSTSSITLQCLWQVLEAWDVADKQAFVKFVTGTDRLPAHPGSEQLIISFPFVACGVTDQQRLLGTLPQSHTCSNTLELPDYAEALTATDAGLAAEWRATKGNNDNAKGSLVTLRQRCCKVLEDRLQVMYPLGGSK